MDNTVVDLYQESINSRKKREEYKDEERFKTNSSKNFL